MSPTASPATHTKATYTNSNSNPSSDSSTTSSTTPFQLSTTISLPDYLSTTQKTTYLTALREAVLSLQEQVNSELTARMEAEAREATTMFTTTTTSSSSSSPAMNGKGGKGLASGVDEAAEEENYGEEVIQDDEER